MVQWATARSSKHSSDIQTTLRTALMAEISGLITSLSLLSIHKLDPVVEVSKMSTETQIYDPDGDVTLILEVLPKVFGLILDREYENDTVRVNQLRRAKILKV
jgi:hypothetical protein